MQDTGCKIHLFALTEIAGFVTKSLQIHELALVKEAYGKEKDKQKRASKKAG
jgi:hypothetical protein